MNIPILLEILKAQNPAFAARAFAQGAEKTYGTIITARPDLMAQLLPGHNLLDVAKVAKVPPGFVLLDPSAILALLNDAG